MERESLRSGDDDLDVTSEEEAAYCRSGRERWSKADCDNECIGDCEFWRTSVYRDLEGRMDVTGEKDGGGLSGGTSSGDVMDSYEVRTKS